MLHNKLALYLFRSNGQNRKQNIKIELINTDIWLVTIPTPERSILGQLLFNILHKMILNNKFVKYLFNWFIHANAMTLSSFLSYYSNHTQ